MLKEFRMGFTVLPQLSPVYKPCCVPLTAVPLAKENHVTKSRIDTADKGVSK